MPGIEFSRTELRARRRALTAAEQRLHAAAVAKRILCERAFLKADRIAFYWPADGEVDLRPLIRIALATGKTCYLPILSPIRTRRYRRTLRFARYPGTSRMQRNRFGIPEPTTGRRHCVQTRRLDLLLMPLVGFDADCHRIGMGGGFYDRTLGRVRRLDATRRPRLIGVAHECQRLEQIAPNPWDVRLDAVITEHRIYPRRPPRTE